MKLLQGMLHLYEDLCLNTDFILQQMEPPKEICGPSIYDHAKGN